MLERCSKATILTLALLSTSMIMIQRNCLERDPQARPTSSASPQPPQEQQADRPRPLQNSPAVAEVSWTKTCLFTISAFNNYGFVKSFLDRAEALNPDIDCFIWVVADNRYVWTTGGDPTLPGQILDDFPKKWQLVLVEQLQPYMNFSFMELAFRYDMTCFNTAIKPPAFKYIFDRYNASKVLYFDNDIWIMQPLTQIVSALEKYSLVITPHITEEIPLDGLRQDERQIMLAGQFNFGFVAASRSKSAFKFFDWWGQRLRLYGYAEPSKGMHFDQNWADLIVSYYPQEEYFILRDPRYNIAYWNLHYRGAHLYMENGRVMYDSEPAVFMHFSGMSSLLDYDIETISRHQNRFKMVQFPNLRPIFEKYLEMLKAEDAMRWRHVPYGFGMFKDGTPIPYVVRTYFAEILDPVNAGQEASRLFHEVVAFEDPFSVDVTPKVSLLSWMLQGVHHLTVEASAPYWVPEIAWQFHRARPDLMAAFPDPLDRHWESYQAWFRVHGVLTTQFVEAERKRRKKKFKGLPMGVNVYCALTTDSVLADVGHAVLVAMESADLPTAAVLLPGPRERKTTVKTTRIPTYDVNLFVASAGDTDAIVKSYPSREWKKHRNIAYWAEELDVFPSDWLQHMNHFDEIWTASDFVTMSIRNSPANAGTPVVTMPLGIDIDLSIYAKARGRFKIPEGTLVFLVMFNGAHQLRNPLAVLAAFRAFQADSGSSNVLLVMKCVRPEGDVTEFQQLEREVNRTNNALLMTDALSRQELCSLMASVDVFVSLHTSASSGLALLQMLMLGKPVIGASSSSTSDFMSLIPEELQFLQIPQDLDQVDASQPSSKDIQMVAEAMSKLMADRSLFDKARRVLGSLFRRQFDHKSLGKRLSSRLGDVKRKS